MRESRSFYEHLARLVKEKGGWTMPPIAFAAVAFLFSLVGFLHPEPAVHYHEYSASAFVLEIVGHFSFGFLAASPLLDVGLALWVGSMAVLIDTDHLLAALGFAVSSRPDHSLAFAAVSSVALALLARRFRVPSSKSVKMPFLGPVVVLSHIAYDVFSATSTQPGGGGAFPLFIPLTFETVDFVGWYWLLFEGIAAAASVAGYLITKYHRRRGQEKF